MSGIAVALRIMIRNISGKFKLDWGLASVLLLALGLRLVGIQFGLPDLLHVDEWALVNHALGFGQGDFNPHFYEYPAFQMYFLFAVYVIVFLLGRLTGTWHSAWDFAVAYFADPTLIQTISRVITVLGAVATVYVVYRITEKNFSRRAGLFAGLILALSPLHVENSRYVTTDVPMIFLASLAIWLSLRFSENKKLITLLLASLVAGLSGATKYPGLAVLPVVAIAPCITLGLSNQLRLKLAALALIAGLAGFLIGSPYTVLAWREFVAGLSFQSHLIGVVGHLGYEDSHNGWLVHLRDSLPLIAYQPVLLLSIVGVSISLRQNWAKAVWLMLFPLLIFLIIGAQKTLFARYSLPLVFAVSVFGGVALAYLSVFFHKRVWAVAFALLFTPMFLSGLESGLRGCFENTRTTARKWVEANISEGQSVGVTRYGPQILQNAESFETYQEYIRKRQRQAGLPEAAAEKTEAKIRLMQDAARGRRTYRVITLDRDWQKDHYAYLKRLGVEYAAVDETMSYRFKDAEKHHPEAARFFEDIARKGQVVKTISPQKARFPSALFPLNYLGIVHPGPEITIYRIR